jgi:hypothetical protein
MLGASSSPYTTESRKAIDAFRLSLADDPAARAVTAIGLFAVGIIHALEIPGQLSGAVWLTIGFIALAVAGPVAGLWLLARPTPLAWEFGGLLCAAAAGGYVLTRSVAVPGDAGDKGNWLEPLGVAGLITEGVVLILAVLVLAGIYRASRATRPWIRAVPLTGTRT